MINMGVNSKTVVPMEPKQKTTNEIIKEIGEQILEKVEETQTEKEEKEQEEAAAVLELSEHTIEQMKSQLESMESEKEGWVNLGKMMEIARRIARGDKVPAFDEKKLLEFDKEMYQSAKMAGLMAKNKKPKRHKSMFEDEKDKELRELMEKYENMSATEMPDIAVENGAPQGESISTETVTTE